MAEGRSAAGGNARRSRRRRRTSGLHVEGDVEAIAADVPEASRERRGKADTATGTERGLRDLVGAGPSQLGVSGALRGRDVNRPTEAELAEAEREVVLVRRHWRPPAS